MRIFTVEGRGDFPLDMLRRDDAEAATPEDQARIDATYANDGDVEMRQVALTTRNRHLTEGRWKSFGWPVVEGGDGIVEPARPHQLWLSVRDTERNLITKAKVLVARISVEGPLARTFGDAVQDMVRETPTLKGAAPYLFNGFLNLAACMVLGSIERGRDGDIAGDRSKIALMPGIEIEIQA